MKHCTIEAYYGPASLDLHYSCPPTRCPFLRPQNGKQCYYYNRRLDLCQCVDAQHAALASLRDALDDDSRSESS